MPKRKPAKAAPCVAKPGKIAHAWAVRQQARFAGAAPAKALWPDCVVEEIGLARNVSILRKALGEDAEGYIETIPRRGYRFTAGVQAAATRPQKAWGIRFWLFAVGAALSVGIITYWQFYRSSRYFPEPSGTPSLAVLPFDRLGPDLSPAFGQTFSDIVLGTAGLMVSALGNTAAGVLGLVAVFRRRESAQ